ncbi:MAG: LacI family DNA-binding transcriptional regulator [Thermomicrobiales bacterium]
MKRRVTIEDIARESNASPTTVSLVLRDKPGIGTETRQRVLEAARQLGYRRRAISRVETTKEVLNVGLVVRSRSRSREDQLPGVNPFYSWVMIGVEAAARAHQMNLLYATLPVDEENRPLDLPRHLLGQSLDGILLIGSFADETVAEVAGSRTTPIVLVDAPARAHPYDAVVSDNEGGAYTAVRHLIDRGRRHIALIGPFTELDPNFSQRREGYLRALREHALTAYERPVVSNDILAAVAALLEVHPDVTAFFGANDKYAIGAMRAARDLGRHVPDDLSVVGFDDVELSNQTTPRLTTMAVDKVSMGRLAVQTLTNRLAWPDSAKVVTMLQPSLLVRESVANR